MYTFLLIVHGLVAVALLGAITHQAVSMLRVQRARSGSFIDRYTGVNQKTFAIAVLVLYVASLALGATRIQAFLKVTLPLLRSSLLSGAIFAFIISFSDINLALFLSGPQSSTLPVQVFSQIQWQADPTIAAASSLQIVIIGLLILVVQRIFRLRLVV